MSVIAEFTVSADSLALSQTLEKAPEMAVEIERVVAHAEDEVTPYLWVRGGDYVVFERAVRDDPTTHDVEKLDEYEDGALYRAKWTGNIQSIVYAYTEVGATILEAIGREDSWEIRMRFDSEQLVTQFNDYCRENDIDFILNRLYNPSEPMGGGQYGLSSKQYEALTTALERGYFNVPRETSMAELADELGIAQQSFSKRLRRAHRTLITNTLTVSHPEDETPPE